ncbi:MAG: DUF433 domain-containing protein [Hymenobacter sp.]|nr:MAG: DUF433 domain-containing protein [Hymenobacter sp.]
MRQDWTRRWQARRVYFAVLRTNLITIDPKITGGTPVFTGTRVSIETLLDYLAAGEPLDEFLANFPSVSREQAIAALAALLPLIHLSNRRR